MDKRVIQLIGVGLVCVLAKLTVYVSEETCPETYITTSCDVTVPSGTCHHIQLEVPGVCERVILRTAARGVDCGAWGVNEELDSPLMDSDCECSSRTCVCLLVANELAADRNISVECREKLWDEENLFVVTIYTGIMKALKCKTLGASVMHIHCTLANIHVYTCIIITAYAYADKCMSVRGSIRKFGKDTSSEKLAAYAESVRHCLTHRSPFEQL